MPTIDLRADLNAEDDEGRWWNLLRDAVDPVAVMPGAVLIAGTDRFWSVVRIEQVDDDGQVTGPIMLKNFMIHAPVGAEGLASLPVQQRSSHGRIHRIGSRVTCAAYSRAGRASGHRHGLAVTCLRVGSSCGRRTMRRELLTWLSVADAIHLVDACLPHIRSRLRHRVRHLQQHPRVVGPRTRRGRVL